MREDNLQNITAIITAVMRTLDADFDMGLEECVTFMAGEADTLAWLTINALDAYWSFQDGVSDHGDVVGYFEKCQRVGFLGTSGERTMTG
jgi:hypothetical protein